MVRTSQVWTSFFLVPMHFFLKLRFPSFEGTIICSVGDRKESAYGEHFPVGNSGGSTWMNSTSPVGLGAWGPLGHGDPQASTKSMRSDMDASNDEKFLGTGM